MAVITSLFNFAIILTVCTCLLFDENYRNKSEKIVLSPLQIVDMVMKEKMKSEPPRDWRRFINRDRCNSSQVTTTELSELSDDETLLKLRKVWSRWSKWGECSTSCGGGMMRRQRVCVAGRCAPGEREDQTRPCSTVPCSPLPLPEEPHDLE